MTAEAKSLGNSVACDVIAAMLEVVNKIFLIGFFRLCLHILFTFSSHSLHILFTFSSHDVTYKQGVLFVIGLFPYIQILTLIRGCKAETREITLRPKGIRRYFFGVQLHSFTASK
jgi:hypothetical protein